MSDKPIPGKIYVVQSGDTPESISKKAYGDSSFTSTIDNANQSESKAGLKVGEKIIIPSINTRKIKSHPLINKKKDELTVRIEDREIELDSASIVRSIDSGAYGWYGVFPWDPGEDIEIDNLLRPYGYPNSQIYIGNELIFSGLVYASNPSLTDSGRIKELKGASYTADAIDSTIKPPYEKNNVTIEQRANELIASIGIGLESDISTGGQFSRITATPEESIFRHLVKLASQRGFLISTNPEGNMVFKKAAGGESVGTLQEGDGIVTDWAAEFDGRKRYSVYRAIGQSPGENSKPSIAKDDAVPRSRSLTFQPNDTTAGNIKNAAEWKRSKQLADSLSIQLPVNTWFSPNGSLWEENTIVTVISKTFSIPDGFNFLIRSVEYNFETSGKTALLTIVPPQVYTGEKLIDPWSQNG